VSGAAAVKLRSCWLTVSYVPRPAAVLRRAFRVPPDMSQTFYGDEPLLGVWALSCQGAQVSRRSVGPVVMTLVAVPVGVRREGDPPLANFLRHALIGTDSDSPRLTAALRRADLPAGLVEEARYRHSPPGALPSIGDLGIPGAYGVRVRATDADPTNPHDHRNDFVYQPRRDRQLRLRLSTDDALDRFCFPESGECAASIRAARRTAFSRLLGGTFADARVGFDHARLSRIDLFLP
jgi:hypothetical protein